MVNPIIKYTSVFVVGLIETFIYACYLMRVTKHQAFLSSLLMFTYMTIYIGIIAYIINNIDTIPLLLVYALSCGIGNFIRIRLEKK